MSKGFLYLFYAAGSVVWCVCISHLNLPPRDSEGQQPSFEEIVENNVPSTQLITINVRLALYAYSSS